MVIGTSCFPEASANLSKDLILLMATALSIHNYNELRSVLCWN